MLLDYVQTLQKIRDLKAKIESNTGRRADNIKELMRLKRTLCRFPEHKKTKAGGN